MLAVCPSIESHRLSALDKSWSEYVEYILDTLDYIQLHQEELGEFHQLASQLLAAFDEKEKQWEAVDEHAWQAFHDQIAKMSEQVEILNQKGEFLLQGAAISADETNDNQVECLLETVNRHYDALTTKTKGSFAKNANIQEFVTKSSDEVRRLN